MLALANTIDAVNKAIGKVAAWGIMFAVLLAVYNAAARKIAPEILYSNKFVDAQWMLFAVSFLFCGSWTLQRNEHIRVDIINAKFSQKTRIWIDILGHILILVPFCIAMVYISWPWYLEAYRGNLQSPNVGGLPYWWARGMLPTAFALLGLQGISEIIKRFAILGGRMEDPYSHSGHSVDVPDNKLSEIEHV